MTTTMSASAKEAQRDYLRSYRKSHKDKLNEYHKQWVSQHKDKVKVYNDRYWEQKASDIKNIQNTLQLFKQFINDNFKLDIKACISNSDLTDAFNKWSSSNMTTTGFSLKFSTAAEQLGLIKARDKHGIIWHGLREVEK